MDGELVIKQFLGNKKWWINENDQGYSLHVIHQDKEYISKTVERLHTKLFKDDHEMKVMIVKLAINSVQVQIKKDENKEKLANLHKLKEMYQNSYRPPYWKKKRKWKEY